MKIEIHSIKSIEVSSMLPFPPRTSLISIGDTDAPAPKLANKPEHILRVEFDDITLRDILEEKEKIDFPTSIKASEEKQIEFLKERNINIFSDEQAKQIANFVLKYNGKTDLLICQCHYGQSRSAGCAAAIAEYFYGNGIDIFADERFCPNKLVYRKVLKALEICES